MTNNTIEETLIGIEQNLEKLDSARRQVLDVTQSGREITATMVELVRSVDQVYKVINMESNSFAANLDAKQYAFNERLDTIVKDTQSSIANFLNHLETITATVSDNITLEVVNASEVSNKLHEKQEIAFHKHLSNIDQINNLLESFKSNLSLFDFKAQLKPLEETIEKNEHALNSFIDTGINSIHKNISEISETQSVTIAKLQSHLIETISELNLDLNSRFQAIKKKHDVSNYISWGLLGVLIALKLIFR